ncbi:MAG: tRNA (adenosine(37)-N6)-dimethylallyltransferase MiaA [Rhodospirillales bacterium RIFCSPLOWO2_12_FULL_58_28]|nr:MAG: tRNA (adenosine(37)-N6)-dimethylallyltransferase MiaA [Rhodospirillales bacterium RIFCSPLOWO2_02_FULL_58_16]OHC77598.1 MAG: tRNA (adenosine(37)-N6)-dimethylallyltransferase MiaA [Rhodospirillales bacterium RIFCSPLOWO2_12_FULL_58_28]
MKPPASFVLIVTGPTASGKSALATDAALEFNGVVINGDSMQVYGELNILSARPSTDDMARVPHRLFGVLAATETCSAGRWTAMAKAEIEAAWDRGLLPIITGGTGLYLKALITGLVSIPAIPDAVRREARELLRRLGPEAFREELRKLSPQDAERIPASDPQRLARAFEVVKATGRELSQWQDMPAAPPLPQAEFAAVVLTPPRADLYAAIDARFDRMIAAGALDEARSLMGADKDLPAMKALGASELLAHLEGLLTLAEAVEKAKRASRNFAKRQLTWLRHQDIGCRAETYSAQYSESIKADIFSFIRNSLLTTQS